MDLAADNSVARYVGYKNQIRDADDKPIGAIPQAFELRLKKAEVSLSVNWLEHFDPNIKVSLSELVEEQNSNVYVNYNKRSGIFCCGNVGELVKIANSLTQNNVKVVHDGNKKNKSHASIIRLNGNNSELTQSFSNDIFTTIVKISEL
jgi:hypothetical protein